jgi:hypothetical protein
MRTLSLTAVLLTVCPAYGQNLETILATHESAVAPLQYLRCQFTKTFDTPWPGRPKVLTGDLVRGPTVILVTAKGVGYESAFLARAGRFEMFTSMAPPSGGKMQTGSIIAATKKVKEDADPLRDMMVVFDIQQMVMGGGGLRDLINTHCKPEVIDAGDEVRIPYLKSEGAVRLSKRHNFLAVGSDAVSVVNGVRNTTSFSVTEFKPGPGGAPVPVAATFSVTENGKTVMAHKTKLIGINTTAFDEATVRIRYPRQTDVVDQITGTQYTVDESGGKVSDTKPFVPLVVGSSPNSKESHLPTADEPAQSGWWLAPAGCSVVALAGAIALYLRRRRRDST